MKNKTLPQLRHNEDADLISLTDKLYTDFSIEVLEERLETDPLLLTGLFDQITPFCAQCKRGDLDCTGTSNCVNCNGAGSTYNDTCSCKTVDAECFKS